MCQNILIVEDDEEVRGLIRQTLENAGYGVREAANGIEAIRPAEEAAFDLVITDILMPEKDGLETIIHLRRENPGTKVIAISGGHNELFLRNARGLGALSVVTKPFTPKTLLGVVAEILHPVGVA